MTTVCWCWRVCKFVVFVLAGRWDERDRNFLVRDAILSLPLPLPPCLCSKYTCIFHEGQGAAVGGFFFTTTDGTNEHLWCWHGGLVANLCERVSTERVQKRLSFACHSTLYCGLWLIGMRQSGEEEKKITTGAKSSTRKIFRLNLNKILVPSWNKEEIKKEGFPLSQEIRDAGGGGATEWEYERIARDLDVFTSHGNSSRLGVTQY